MKGTVDRSSERLSKSNKRSQALKHILENPHGVTVLDETSSLPTIKAIQDGRLANNSQTMDPKKDDQGTGDGAQAIKQPPHLIELVHGLIHKELAKAADHLGINETELKTWMDLQNEVPARTMLTLLRMMQNLHLDPLCEEIGFTQYDDGQWQVFITIEGCSKLLNQHPQFNGLVFTQADTLIDGVPEWMECSIYRKDRIVPTTAREYLTEVRGENPIWQKMPRRMLRHRALQQCVRLAIGLI